MTGIRGSTGIPSARDSLPRSYTVAEIRAAEQPLLAAGAPLMRRAAAALADQVRATGRSPVFVLAGAGDNGGDALYAAARLLKISRKSLQMKMKELGLRDRES